jgi:transglutaminase-like putative cysteine protease
VELGKEDAVALSTGGWALAYVVGDLDDGAAFIDRALALLGRTPTLADGARLDCGASGLEERKRIVCTARARGVGARVQRRSAGECVVPVDPGCGVHGERGAAGEVRTDPELLRYLLNSRYCEVDRLSNIAVELFGHLKPGWSRVQAICGWVNWKVAFGYHHARSSKTALDVFTERTGVCRDFQHLAVTFCRALNIPARYATGYLGDIGVPKEPTPMDFSAWFEVYLQNRWWTFDARHVNPRIGRVLMATGRDASDVAITTSFGIANLTGFSVVTDEVTK